MKNKLDLTVALPNEPVIIKDPRVSQSFEKAIPKESPVKLQLKDFGSIEALPNIFKEFTADDLDKPEIDGTTLNDAKIEQLPKFEKEILIHTRPDIEKITKDKELENSDATYLIGSDGSSMKTRSKNNV